MKATLRIILTACALAITAQAMAQKAKTTASAFDAFVAALAKGDYITSSTSETYKDGYYKKFLFSLPEKRKKEMDEFNNVMLRNSLSAYNSVVKKAGGKDISETQIGYGDNNSQSMGFGSFYDRNYNIQMWHDPSDSTKRYAYVLYWKPEGSTIMGGVYKFYGKNPKIRAEVRVPTFMGTSTLPSSNKSDQWAKSYDKYAKDSAPRNSTDFMQQFGNLRALYVSINSGFEEYKKSWGWTENGQNEVTRRLSLMTGVANKMLQLCKEHGSLLGRDGKLAVSNAIYKMRKDTSDEYLADILMAAAKAVNGR